MSGENETKNKATETNAEAAKAKAEQKDTASKRAYKALGNLRHNGKGYTTGKTVYLTPKEAKPLLDAKVVAPAEEKSK